VGSSGEVNTVKLDLLKQKGKEKRYTDRVKRGGELRERQKEGEREEGRKRKNETEKRMREKRRKKREKRKRDRKFVYV
jgi:hypothetical protein